MATGIERRTVIGWMIEPDERAPIRSTDAGAQLFAATSAGSTTTTISTLLTGASNAVYVGQILRCVGGTAANVGVDVIVLEFNAGTDTLTHTAFPSATADNDQFGLFLPPDPICVETTGGGTTSLIAGNMPTDFAADDDFNNGTAIVIRDSAGAAAAPEGEFNRISDFVASSGTFTVDTAFTAAVASGDMFGFTKPEFDLQTLRRLMNEALQDIGDMPLVDTTTLDSAAQQTEYTWSVAWKRRRPTRIDIQEWTGDANDNRWVQIYDWEPVPAAAGSTGLLIFSRQPITGRDIRVWYVDRHPVVHAFSDKINELIDPELVARSLIFQIRNYQLERDGGQNPAIMHKWNKAKNELLEIKAERPVWKPKRKSRLLVFDLQDQPSDELPSAPI